MFTWEKYKMCDSIRRPTVYHWSTIAVIAFLRLSVPCWSGILIFGRQQQGACAVSQCAYRWLEQRHFMFRSEAMRFNTCAMNTSTTFNNRIYNFWSISLFFTKIYANGIVDYYVQINPLVSTLTRYVLDCARFPYRASRTTPFRK